MHCKTTVRIVYNAYNQNSTTTDHNIEPMDVQQSVTLTHARVNN